METTQENEEKRSKEWWAVFIVTSILILAIVVFFVTKVFVTNPILGTWVNEENEMTMTVEKSSVITVDWPGTEESGDVGVELSYSLDKKGKVIDIAGNESSVAEILNKQENGADMQTDINMLIGSFDYSVDGDMLTLTDREYGEQLTFTLQE